MKKILKSFGIITLICFSFFYTEKVMTVVSEQDPLKIEITNKKEKYKISPNEAQVTKDTIIPGTTGREVNIEKSYKKMRKYNIFNEKLLVYDPIYPEYTLKENKDKYIIKGNINKKEVSFIFIINSNNNFKDILNILNQKEVISNLFIDYNYLNNNISNIKNNKNHYIYSYQEEYSYEKLLISNNIIEKLSNNKPIFCLTKQQNKNNLNTCSYVSLNTVIPSVKGNLTNIKNNLENGSIILLDTSQTIVKELSYIIDFIEKKGYKIVSLETLLKE